MFFIIGVIVLIYFLLPILVASLMFVVNYFRVKSIVSISVLRVEVAKMKSNLKLNVVGLILGLVLFFVGKKGFVAGLLVISDLGLALFVGFLLYLALSFINIHIVINKVNKILAD